MDYNLLPPPNKDVIKALQKAYEPKKTEVQPVERPSKIVCVDFDGTCVTHEYPEVGKDVPYCFEVLKRLEANGVKIILWTMRSGSFLGDAVLWFEVKGIPLWGVNENPQQKEWTNSPKCYAQAYIDDAAIGCPLIYPESGRPFVDWIEVEKILIERGFLD